MTKTIPEPNKTVPVIRECDVVVVGGGPGGIGAAVAAARNGADHPFFMRSNLKGQENIVWVHPRYATRSQIDVEELTRVEFLGREKMLLTHEFYKKNIPGFESSFIVLSGPQLGTRGARRVHGDYMVTGKDLLSNDPFEDTIAIFPDLDRGEASLAHPNTFIPYRSLLPKC